MTKVFLLEIFVICFRESMEASVIMAVLLSFLKQSFSGPGMNKKAYHRLLWHVWLGAALGLLICLIIGGGFIGAFYGLDNDIWGNSEDLWEGILSVIASVMITAMGFGMLRVNKMKAKWRYKIAEALLEEDRDEQGNRLGFKARMKRLNPLQFRLSKLGKWTRKYAMFLLPFVTVMREGLEAVVFVGGVGLGQPAESFPLSVVLGLLCGLIFGYVLYKFGALVSLKYFLIFSTCLLYLIAAGLFSRAVWYLQMNTYSKKTGGDAAENGSGPGTYNIHQSVWHVNCCNPETNDNGWGIFNALFGWQNSATYGSVISYNAYWIFIMVFVCIMQYEEKTGKYPIVGLFWKRKQIDQEEADRMYARAQKAARKIDKRDEEVKGDLSQVSDDLTQSSNSNDIEKVVSPTQAVETASK